MTKVKEICSTSEGLTEFRLQKGLIKQLNEEVVPLAFFGRRKFGDTSQVFLQPVIGNQPYDAVVTDLRTTPAAISYVEITQAHEGENNYWRRLELLKRGCVFSYAPVVKTGKKGSQIVSISPDATSVEERTKNELERIRNAALKKQGRDYPGDTSLLIFFDDTPPFGEAVNNERLVCFVGQNILNLDLRFSTLYLVGEHQYFKNFILAKEPPCRSI